MSAQLIPALVLLALPLLSSAQAIYRCGNTFSEVKCSHDAKVIVAPPEPPAKRVDPPEPIIVPPSAEQVEANKKLCEAKVRAQMKDPESARITGTYRGGLWLERAIEKSFYIITYYLDVNAKNGYGAYTGDRSWVCAFSLDEKTYIGSRDISP